MFGDEPATDKQSEIRLMLRAQREATVVSEALAEWRVMLAARHPNLDAVRLITSHVQVWRKTYSSLRGS